MGNCGESTSSSYRYWIHPVFRVTACCDCDVWPFESPEATQHIYKPTCNCHQHWVKFPWLVFEICCSQAFQDALKDSADIKSRISQSSGPFQWSTQLPSGVHLTVDSTWEYGNRLDQLKRSITGYSSTNTMIHKERVIVTLQSRVCNVSTMLTLTFTFLAASKTDLKS